MKEEESIEKFLEWAKDQPTISLYEACKSIFNLPNDSKDRYKIQELCYTLQVYNIVEETKADDPYFMLSKLGRQIIKEGGWVKYSKKKKMKEKFLVFFTPTTTIITTCLAAVSFIYSIKQYNLNESQDKFARQQSHILDSLEQKVSAIQLKIQVLENKSTIHEYNDTVSKKP